MIKMKNKGTLLAFLFFLLVNCLFFYPVILKRYTPFPGDLLLSHYKPWQASSYLGYLPGSIPTKWQYFDTLRQIYPWRQLATDMLKIGQLPLWNPYNFSGTPLLANFQSAVFYPLNLLFLIFSKIDAWTITVFLQPVLSGFFLYLFSRKIGWSARGAVFSGISFAYCAFMAVFLEYNTINQSILWLPLILYFFELLREKVTFKRQISFVLSLVFAIFAGHPQSAVLVWFFAFLYILFRLITSDNKNLLLYVRLFVLMIISLGIASVQLLPTFELATYSARTSHDYVFLVEKLLIQPKQLIMFFVPDFFGNPATGNYLLNDTYPGKAVYIGLVPLFFSFWSLRYLRINKILRFWAMSALVIIALVVSWPFSKIFYHLKIPFFSSSSPGNAIFLLEFSLAMLSGWGIESWLREKENRKRYFFQLIPIFLFLLVWAGLLLSWRIHYIPNNVFKISAKNLLYSSLILGAFSLIAFSFFKFGYKRLAYFLFLILTIADLFYFFKKFNPFVPKEAVFPENEVFSWLSNNAGVNRFWGYGAANVEPNFGMVDRIYSPDGYDPLYPKRYGEWLYSSNQGKLLETFDRSTRSDAIIAQSFGAEQMSNNPYRLTILSLLGTKYILDRTENGSDERTFPIDQYRLVWEKNGWRIFENLSALPRAFLVSNYLLFQDKDQFEKIFYSSNFNPSRSVLLEEKPTQSPSNATTAESKIVQYSPNQIAIATKADANQFLVLSDTFYPGWVAKVDGAVTKIYRANWTLRAVFVPSGEHTVTFSYKPRSFLIGAKISLFSLLLLFIFTYLWQSRIKLRS